MHPAHLFASPLLLVLVVLTGTLVALVQPPTSWRSWLLLAMLVLALVADVLYFVAT